jgi:hypothetical protein
MDFVTITDHDTIDGCLQLADRPDCSSPNAVLQLASSPLLRRHLGASAIRAARERTWERALEQLAAGYRRALEAGAGQAASRAA